MISRVPSYEVSSDEFSGGSDETLPLLDPRKPPKSLRLLHLFVLFFAGTSNLGLTALTVELPLIVGGAPEGWSLPSWCTLAAQLANLFAVAYFAVDRWVVDLRDSPINVICLIGGLIGSCLMAGHYDMVQEWGGRSLSVVVLACAFTFSVIGCMSSLSSLPYVGRFSEVYMKTYLVGEGLSSLLPGALALIQGLESVSQCRPSNVSESGLEQLLVPSRFPISSYFSVIFAVFFVGMVSFVLLSSLRRFRSEYAAIKIGTGNWYMYDTHENASESGILNLEGLYLLSLLTLMFALSSGVLPSVQPYSCLPYGGYVFHLVVALSTFSSPLTYLVSYYVKQYSIRTITKLAVAVLALDGFVIWTSVLETPPFIGTFKGEIFIISAWLVLGCLHTYIRLSIVMVLRSKGQRSLVWSGVATQTGSLIGALVAFLAITYSGWFRQRGSCVLSQ